MLTRVQPNYRRATSCRGPETAQLGASLGPWVLGRMFRVGQVGVGGNKCALRDHSEVPGVVGMELSLGSSARENAGETWDILTSPQCPTGVVTSRDGWAQVLPSSSPPALGWHLFGLS